MTKNSKNGNFSVKNAICGGDARRLTSESLGLSAHQAVPGQFAQTLPYQAQTTFCACSSRPSSGKQRETNPERRDAAAACCGGSSDAMPRLYAAPDGQFARGWNAYGLIRDTLHTGDVVLFRGNGRVSRWIRAWCWLFGGAKPVWASHIGALIIESGRVMLLESTSIQGGFKGVRLLPMSDAVDVYDGQIKVRRLIWRRKPDQTDQIACAFAAEMIGRPYERSVLELMRAGWSIDRNRRQTLESVFCSELVAALYQRLGLLPPTPTANNYAPHDFARGGRVDSMLRLRGAAELSDEINVK